MKPILIAAGRGSRLESLTDNQPKCYTSVAGKRILDWTLEAFQGAGLPQTVFIGGYQFDLVRREYPHLTFCHNADWANNNILLSLMYAESHMDDGFICSYSDILFLPSIVRRALEHPADIVLCIDTHWRDRYADRTKHPEDDAEKILADGDRILRIHRDIPSDEAGGEYIGVARFSPAGAKALREHYHRIRKEFAGKFWPTEKPFEKAYLIHLFQEMLDRGVDIRMVTTAGDYMEIDTDEDLELANRSWPARFESSRHSEPPEVTSNA